MIMMDTCAYTFVLTHRMYNTGNSNVNCRLWEIMMSQWRSVLGNIRAMQGRDAGKAGGCACVGAGGPWGISVPSSPFCGEPKTALKKSQVFAKKKLASAQ